MVLMLTTLSGWCGRLRVHCRRTTAREGAELTPLRMTAGTCSEDGTEAVGFGPAKYSLEIGGQRLRFLQIDGAAGTVE
jgi:hypothetical protein